MANLFSSGFWKFFLVFTLIFISDDSLLFGTNGNTSFIYFKYFFYACVTGVMLFYDILSRKEFYSRVFLYCVSLLFLSFLSQIANQDFLLGNMFRCCLLLYALCFVSRVSLNEFAQYFDMLMYPLAILSLVLFSITFINDSFIIHFPVITNSASNKFFSIGVYNSFIPFIGRNYGFCREPGVYQAFLFFAILFQLSGLIPAKTKKIVVYVVTLLTTLSTTGYIALICLLPLVVLRHKDLRLKNFFLMALLLIAFVLIYQYTDLLSADGKVFEKFYRTNYNDGDSSVSRFASVFCNAKIFLENPFLGVGIEKIFQIFPTYSLEMFSAITKSNTNTILYFFAVHGVFYGFILSYFFLSFARCLTTKTIESIVIALSLIVVCCGELFYFSGWVYVFAFYGFNHFLGMNNESF